MSEVIKLEYNASTAAFVVSLDALTPTGIPIMGVPLPSKRVTLADLDAHAPVLAAQARAFLSAVHDYVRDATAQPLTAEEVAAQATALAAREEAAVRAEQAAEAKRDAAAREKAALDADIARARAAKAQLDAEIEAAKKAKATAAEPSPQ